MSRRRLLLAVLLLASIAAYFAFDLGQYFRIEFFQSRQSTIEDFRRANPLAAAAIFFAIYVAVTGLSVPGAAILSVAVGAIFGLLWGTLIVSFASSIGATLAFLISRFLLRDWVQRRFGTPLQGVNAGIEREGAFYLFTLRLIPVIPFFVINLAMGLTPLRARTFYWVSQLGMLACTLVYVNAGTQLEKIASPGDILSWQLIGAFLLLGLFPLLAKKIVDGVRARRVYARWKQPARFDRNLVVIGAGSAGLVAAYIAATVRAKVTLVEKHRMGGDCLNTGCVPSKALIKSARVLSQIRKAEEFGLRNATAEVDFAGVMERVQRVIKAVEPHDSAARYTALGVECIQGEARIASPWTVEISTASGTRTLSTRAIVIAAGARPFV